MIARALIMAVLATMAMVAPAGAYVPHQAYQWRNDLTRQARLVWGMTAPVATFGAQIHQESRWNPTARSPVGARGLAQFMPGTAQWISEEFAAELGENAPLNPQWALRAMVRYNRWLWERVTAVTECERMAMTLSAYNGGLGNLRKEIDQARARVWIDPERWFGHVEVMSRRADWAWEENRTYVIRILLEHEPRYVDAGWGVGSCSGWAR